MDGKTHELPLLISSDHLAERKSWPDMIRRTKSLDLWDGGLGTELVDGSLASTGGVRARRPRKQTRRH